MSDVHFVTKEIPVYLPTTGGDRIVVGTATVEANGQATIIFNDEGGKIKDLLQEDWLTGISFDFLAGKEGPVNLNIHKE